MKKGGAAFGLLLILLAAGCGSRTGPVTAGNIFSNYPPKVRAVDWNVPASVVKVWFQPFDATEVKAEGWTILKRFDTESGKTGWRLQFQQDSLSGRDTTEGIGYFVITAVDWPSGWNGYTPLFADLVYYFLITVRDPDGARVKVELWRLAEGAAERRCAPAMLERDWQATRSRCRDLEAVRRVFAAFPAKPAPLYPVKGEGP